MRPVLALTVLASGLALGEEPAPSNGPSHKVGVVSFAALSGEVPLRAGGQAAAMLTNELRNTESVQVVESKRPPPADPFHDALAQAKGLVDEGQAQRAHHKFRLAEDALQKAITAYRGAAAGLSDAAELQDAYALLSAVQFNTGQDDAAQKSLAQALTLAPSRDLPLAATSPLFARVVANARKDMDAAAKGSILVESSPAAAVASVDGVVLGATPLRVRDVPPGAHLWRVQLPSGEAAGGVVDVTAGKAARVSGQIAGGDPASHLLASLTQNTLDGAALAAAKEAAAALEAEWLVFGAISREGKDLALDAFLLDVSAGQLRRLPRANFDVELLSAGVELYNVAGEISRKGAQAGEPAHVPGRVAEARVSGPPRVAEAQYGASANRVQGEPDAPPDTPTPTDGTRAPLSKSRKPLKK
jgi:hypothetical protein